jgi:hypothetical protein
MGWTRVSLLFAIQVVFAALAMSLYQSLVTLLAVGGLGVILWSAVMRKTAIFKLGSHLATFAMAVILGAVLYLILWKAFLYLLHIKPDYIDNFMAPGLLLADPHKVLATTFAEMRAVYGGSRGVYGIFAWSFALIPLIGLLALASTNGLRGQPAMRGIALVLSAAMLALPFAQNPLSGGEMPYRSLAAVPAAMWFFAFMGLEAGGNLIFCSAATVAVVAAAQTLYIFALFQAADAVAGRYDERLAGAIYTRIEEAREGSGGREQSKVEFFGAPMRLQTPYPRIETVGAPIFEWEGGNPYRIVSLFKVLGYRKIDPVTKQERINLTPEFGAMAAWPAKSAIRVVGDVTLVKLGDTPGSVHTELMKRP